MTYFDVYHDELGQFSVKTGLQANPKRRKAFNLAKAEAEDMRRQFEKDWQADPLASFGRKTKSAGDFVEYMRTSIEKTRYPIETNTLKKLIAFSGGFVPFDKLNSVWLERFKVFLLNDDSISQNTAKLYLGVIRKTIRCKESHQKVGGEAFTGTYPLWQNLSKM